MIKPFVNWLIVSGTAAALVSCGGDQKKEPETAPPSLQATPTEPQLTPAARATPMPTTEPSMQESTAPDTWPKARESEEEEAAASAKQAMTDEQIAAVTNTVNDAEIAQAKVAQKNSKNVKVKKFAAMMIKDHTLALQNQKKLLTKLHVTPADNTMSTQLKTETEQKTADLKELKGPDFDRAYMDAQVDEHQKVLDALDNQLIPNAKDAEYKGLLMEVREKVSAHLEMAKEIQQNLLDAQAKSTPSGKENSSGKEQSPTGKGTMPNEGPDQSQKPGPSDMSPHQH